MILLLGFLPSVSATRGNRGRKTVIAAFQHYFANKSHESASNLTASRYKIQEKYGMSVTDMAHFELGNSLALLANTVSSAFWVLYHLFADHTVLADVRAEIAKSLKTTPGTNGPRLHTLDMSIIKDNPLLVSLFQESLRHHSFGTSVRIVSEDVLLDNTYLLKQGSIVQMPNRATQFDRSIWGPNVDEFDARRFIKSNATSSQRPGSFRVFGGGTFLCAGRFFAITEIMSVVAMFAMRYDMTPTKSGKWILPEPELRNMVPAVSGPKKDICVELVPRKEYQRDSWELGIQASKQ